MENTMNTFSLLTNHLHDLSPYLTQILVFIHLFAFAFAIVMIISEDVKLLTSKKIDVEELHSLAKKVSYLLGILWITGIGLLALKPGLDLSLILANSKLAAKVTIVSILTINGILLHLIVFPSFNSERKAKRMVALSSVLGAISTTSWIFASLIGAARAVAPMMSYENYIGLYLTAMTFALLVAVTVIIPLMNKILDSMSFSEHSSDFLLNETSFSNSLRELRMTSQRENVYSTHY